MRIRGLLPAMMAVAILPISTLSSDKPSWLMRTVNRLFATQQAPGYGVDINNSGYPVERSACVTIAIGPSAAAECGNLRIAHPLPGVRTFDEERTPTLLYNSEFAHPYPFFPFAVMQQATTTTPAFVEIKLWLVKNGVEDFKGTQRWPGSAWPSGVQSIRRIAFIYDALDGLVDTTGYYTYRYEIANIYPDSSRHAGAKQEAILPIINRSTSRFGAGWWLAGLEQLVGANPSEQVIVWVGGDGSARQFLQTDPLVDTAWVTSAYARIDSLWYRADSSLWVRRGAEGVLVTFDAAGRHIRTTNRLGRTTTFAHGTDTLTVTLPPNGLQYKFVHPSNRLTSVIAPPIGGTSRVTQITNPSGQITSIRNPGDSAVTFAYRTGSADVNFIAQITDRMGIVDTFYYNTGKRLFSSRIRAPDTTQNYIIGFVSSESRGRVPTAYSMDEITTVIDGPRPGISDTTIMLQSRFGPARVIVNPEKDTTFVQHRMCVPPWPQTCGWSPARIHTPGGGVQKFEYAPTMGNPIRVIDSVTSVPGVTNTTHYTWNTTFDQLAMVIRPEQDTMVFHLDPVDGKRLWQQPGTPASDTTRRVNFSYHSTSKVLQTVTLPAVSGQTAAYTFSHDPLGNTASVTTPMQYVSTFLGDGIGRTVRITSPIDTLGNQFIEQRLTYDILDRLRDDTTLVSYYGTGVAQESTFVRHTYNIRKQTLSTSRWSGPDPNNIDTLTTFWRYDQVGRRIAEEAPDGSVDSVVVDKAGNPILIFGRRSSSGPADTLQYDGLNRLARRVIPSVSRDQPTWQYQSHHGGNTAGFPYPYEVPTDVQEYTYTPDGQIETANNKYSRVTRAYAPNGLLIAETQQVAREDTTFSGHSYTIQYKYDRNGRRRRVQVPSIFTTASGDTINYTYHAVTGDLIQVRDASGAVFSFEQSVRGEDTTIAYPGSYVRRMSWDHDGRLLRDRIENSDTTSGGRWPHHPIRNHSAMDYDARGKLLRSDDDSYYGNSTTTSYRGLGSLATMGLKSIWRNPLGGYTEYGVFEWLSHDPLGNLVAILHDDSTKAQGVTAYRYVDKVYRYDSNGRLVSIDLDQPPGGGYFDGESVYSYDAAGNVEYDREAVFGVGPNRERVSIYSRDNRLVALDTWVTPWAYGPGVEHYNEEYRYDALGRRVWVRMIGRCVGSTTPECFTSFIRRTVWDGEQELAEIQVPGDTAYSGQWEQDTGSYAVTHTFNPGYADPNRFYGQVLYTHGAAVDAPLSVIRFNYTDTPASTPVTWAGTKTIVPFWNNQGMAPLGAFASGAVDTAYNGALPCAGAESSAANRCYVISWFGSRTAYDQQYGNQRRYYWHGSLLEGKRDVGGGLDYRRNRYYDPKTGRFTQEDPIGLAGGLNLYGFAKGDPVNFSDPFGLCPEFLTGRPCSDAFAIGFGFIPVVGDAVDITGALLGRDLLTGEKISGVSLAATIIGTVVGSGKLGREAVKVAGGHAFVKHVLERGEFAGLGIRTTKQFGAFIDNIINTASGSDVRRLSRGRTAYWDNSTGTVVILDPRSADGGTAFRPQGGREYFEGLK